MSSKYKSTERKRLGNQNNLELSITNKGENIILTNQMTEIEITSSKKILIRKKFEEIKGVALLDFMHDFLDFVDLSVLLNVHKRIRIIILKISKYKTLPISHVCKNYLELNGIHKETDLIFHQNSQTLESFITSINKISTEEKKFFIDFIFKIFSKSEIIEIEKIENIYFPNLKLILTSEYTKCRKFKIHINNLIDERTSTEIANMLN